MDKGKEKIGILTFTHASNKNYGALLQAYALYTYLNKNGFNAYIIDYRKKLNVGFFKKINFYAKKILFKNYEKKEVLPFQDFIDENLKKKTKKLPADHLKNLNEVFSTFIVGSDQVWRYKYTYKDGLIYFLDFVNDENNKIAYAASFGQDSWDVSDKGINKKVKKLLKRFDYISVREKSGVSICKNLFDIHVVHTLDPVFLLASKTYDSLIEEKDLDNNRTPFIGTMILDESDKNMDLINVFKSKLQIESIPILGERASKFYFKYNTFSKWLSLFKQAELILTDSFHGLCFSIIFQKEFYCIRNDKRGAARMENLLSKLDLMDRLIYDKSDIDSKNSNSKINYKAVNHRSVNEINKSKDFLEKSLN